MARRDYTEWDSEANYQRLLHMFAVSAVTRDPELIREMRWRLRYDLTPAMATDVGLTLADLQAFVDGFKMPRRDPLARLARRLGLRP